MLQIYFLAVVVNLLMGGIILFDKLKGEGYDGDGSFMHNNTFVLTLTIFACIIACSTLVAPYSGVPLLGDFLITVTTFAGYFVFLTRYIKANYPNAYTGNNWFALVEGSEFYIAIACLVMAVLHFFFPQALFL